jgi:hypothetical protein
MFADLVTLAKAKFGWCSCWGVVKQVRLSANVQLSNTRDTITILGPEDQIVDQVSYESRDLPDEGHTMVF